MKNKRFTKILSKANFRSMYTLLSDIENTSWRYDEKLLQRQRLNTRPAASTPSKEIKSKAKPQEKENECIKLIIDLTLFRLG